MKKKIVTLNAAFVSFLELDIGKLWSLELKKFVVLVSEITSVVTNSVLVS